MAEDNIVRTSLAARLREARIHAGLSQGQVGKLLGLHRPSISQIEAGSRKVSAEELTRFSEIYSVSLSWLTNDQSEVPSPAVELAARELAKLKKEDLDRVLRLLRSLRKAGGAQK